MMNRQWDKIECKHQIVCIMPKGPTHHAYEWQIGPFWQDTIEISITSAPSGTRTYLQHIFGFDGLIVCLISAKLSHRRSQPPQVFLGNNIYRVTKCMALQRTTCVPHAHKILMYPLHGCWVYVDRLWQRYDTAWYIRKLYTICQMINLFSIENFCTLLFH